MLPLPSNLSAIYSGAVVLTSVCTTTTTTSDHRFALPDLYLLYETFTSSNKPVVQHLRPQQLIQLSMIYCP